MALPNCQFERFAPELHALDTARVRRNHRNRRGSGKRCNTVEEQRMAVQMDRAQPERVVERGNVMRFKGDQRVGADRLEQLRNVAAGDRVARLRAAILARVGQIGNDRRHACRAVVFQRRNEKQQSGQLVVRAGLGAAMQALHDVGISTPYIDQRACLVLAVLELALFVRARRQSESACDGNSELAARVECE
jgi:hypothetical protein